MHQGWLVEGYQMRMNVLAWVAVFVLAAGGSFGFAAEKSTKPAGETVGVFDGIKSGDVEVKVIPKDSTGGTIILKNKSKKPLTIAMPEAFAMVPVAAQFGGGGMGGMGGGG